MIAMELKGTFCVFLKYLFIPIHCIDLVSLINLEIASHKTCGGVLEHTACSVQGFFLNFLPWRCFKQLSNQFVSQISAIDFLKSNFQVALFIFFMCKYTIQKLGGQFNVFHQTKVQEL